MAAIVSLESLGLYLFGFGLNEWGVVQAELPRIPPSAGSQILPGSGGLPNPAELSVP